MGQIKAQANLTCKRESQLSERLIIRTYGGIGIHVRLKILSKFLDTSSNLVRCILRYRQSGEENVQIRPLYDCNISKRFADIAQWQCDCLVSNRLLVRVQLLALTKQSSKYKNEFSAIIFISIIAMLLMIQSSSNSVSEQWRCCIL